LRQAKSRWGDNIKTNRDTTLCEDMDSIHLAEDMDEWSIIVKLLRNFLLNKM
jgi:hypothetical protein